MAEQCPNTPSTVKHMDDVGFRISDKTHWLHIALVHGYTVRL
jgi:hypothetical protein